MQPEITPVILAGGNGTRLRPLTSASRPKPFLRLVAGRSLFQDTVLRAGLFGPPLVVCHEDHGQKALAHLEEINVWPEGIILEPESRNTAAAIALTAFHMRDKDGLMLVMPSDHVVPDHAAFQSAVLKAAQGAKNGSIVMIGVTPKQASTRFGYICTDGRGDKDLYKITRFAEKPDKKTARAFLSSRTCFWNTGIFLSAPRVFLEILREGRKDIYDLAANAALNSKKEGIFIAPRPEDYAEIPKISVDYAVMENCQGGLMAALEGDWSDVGCWPALVSLKIRPVHGAGFLAYCKNR